MRKRILIIGAVYSLLIGILCWYILSPENAEWLRVETPSGALQNHQLNLRITLTKPEPGMYLSVDLHWMTNEKVTHGYLTGIKPIKIKKDKTVYDISITFKAEGNARFIFPVVFLSRDGSWITHTKAAESEPIPLLRSNLEASFSPLETKRTNDITKPKAAVYTESAPLRFVVAGLWLAVALITISMRKHLNIKMITTAAVITALWEACNTSSLSGNALRYIAWFIKAYNDRREPQQISTILIFISFALISFFLVYALYKKGTMIIWLSFLVFWSVSLLRILSLHEVDTLFSKTIAQLPIGQLIRLAASFLCLAAILIKVFVSAHRKQNSSAQCL